LHSEEGTQNVEDVIGCGDFAEFLLFFWFVGDESEQDEDGDDVDDEGITTPRCHHVEVGQG
jgi:hypothetical protein